MKEVSTLDEDPLQESSSSSAGSDNNDSIPKPLYCRGFTLKVSAPVDDDSFATENSFDNTTPSSRLHLPADEFDGVPLHKTESRLPELEDLLSDEGLSNMLLSGTATEEGRMAHKDVIDALKWKDPLRRNVELLKLVKRSTEDTAWRNAAAAEKGVLDDLVLAAKQSTIRLNSLFELFEHGISTVGINRSDLWIQVTREIVIMTTIVRVLRNLCGAGLSVCQERVHSHGLVQQLMNRKQLSQFCAAHGNGHSACSPNLMAEAAALPRQVLALLGNVITSNAGLKQQFWLEFAQMGLVPLMVLVQLDNPTTLSAACRAVFALMYNAIAGAGGEFSQLGQELFFTPVGTPKTISPRGSTTSSHLMVTRANQSQKGLVSADASVFSGSELLLILALISLRSASTLPASSNPCEFLGLWLQWWSAAEGGKGLWKGLHVIMAEIRNSTLRTIERRLHQDVIVGLADNMREGAEAFASSRLRFLVFGDTKEVESLPPTLAEDLCAFVLTGACQVAPTPELARQWIIDCIVVELPTSLASAGQTLDASGVPLSEVLAAAQTTLAKGGEPSDKSSESRQLTCKEELAKISETLAAAAENLPDKATLEESLPIRGIIDSLTESFSSEDLRPVVREIPERYLRVLLTAAVQILQLLHKLRLHHGMARSPKSRPGLTPWTVACGSAGLSPQAVMRLVASVVVAVPNLAKWFAIEKDGLRACLNLSTSDETEPMLREAAVFAVHCVTATNADAKTRLREILTQDFSGVIDSTFIEKGGEMVVTGDFDERTKQLRMRMAAVVAPGDQDNRTQGTSA